VLPENLPPAVYSRASQAQPSLPGPAEPIGPTWVRVHVRRVPVHSLTFDQICLTALTSVLCRSSEAASKGGRSISHGRIGMAALQRAVGTDMGRPPQLDPGNSAKLGADRGPDPGQGAHGPHPAAAEELVDGLVVAGHIRVAAAVDSSNRRIA
jgi:hypothetical protein